MRLTSLAQPREDAAFGVMHDEPFEPGIFAIEFVQRRHGPVEAIEITHQRLDAGVAWVVEKKPIGRMIKSPFAFLSELAAHEQERLARATERETIKCAR